MRIYGPGDVLAVASQVREGLADGADQAKELLELVPRLIALVSRAENLLDGAERTLARTDQVVEAADRARAEVSEVAARAAEAVTRSEQTLARTDALLAAVEEVAPDALPIIRSVVEQIDPNEVRAINGLIDRLPGMLDQLDQVAPDVHSILESVTDLTQATKGLPGVGALIRRGERKAEEAEESGDESLATGADDRG